MKLDNKIAIKESSLQAKIIRKDGTVEDLGTISYWSSNPFKRVMFNFTKLILKFWR